MDLHDSMRIWQYGSNQESDKYLQSSVDETSWRKFCESPRLLHQIPEAW